MRKGRKMSREMEEESGSYGGSSSEVTIGNDGGELNGSWTFWYDNSAKGKVHGGVGSGGGGRRGNSRVDLHNWDSFLQHVLTFNTLRKFWG